MTRACSGSASPRRPCFQSPCAGGSRSARGDTRDARPDASARVPVSIFRSPSATYGSRSADGIERRQRAATSDLAAPISFRSSGRDRPRTVTFLNLVAEKMTGWSVARSSRPAHGRSFRNPGRPSRETPESDGDGGRPDRTVHLPSNYVLIRRDGFEIPIEDSVSPIHDREGNSTGAVIVFRDVSAARAMALQITHSAEHDFLTGLPNRMLLERPGQPGHRLGAASHKKSRSPVSGSGWLQTHQRLPGTSHRRQTSSIHRQAPGGMCTRLGHRKPPGRR